MYQKKAKAKINLFLNIIGKDSRGYHLLESFFALLHHLNDTVSIGDSSNTECKISGATIDGENIALKAVKAIRALKNTTKNVQIQIEKQIPVAAGLGGGSSDAASVILLLNQLWELNLSQSQMLEVASSIGADVPFFIHEHHALTTGIGDIVKPIELGISLPLLVLYPMILMSTQEVYKVSVKNFSPTLGSYTKERLIREILSGKNDLEEPAFKLQPMLGDIIAIISQQNGCIAARMSGSGSTCFGIYSDEALALVSLQNLRNRYPSFRFHYELLQL